MIKRVEKGTLDPKINEVLPLEEFPAALNSLKGRQVRGKIIIRMQS
ncbi:zinc-binding dehydrogenase [Bacillus sp. SA1-12]